MQKRTALYHGWVVVAAAFVVAMFGFGLGFYGPGIYLVALAARNGWSIAQLSPAVTLYYLSSASLLFFAIGPLFERCGARIAVPAGTAAMATGLVLLGMARRQWQVYAAFALMSPGWAATSGAAVNIILAAWFDRRRGLALSWALSGASAGGILAPPLLIHLIARVGLSAALALAAAAMLGAVLPLAGFVLRQRRPGERDRADAAAIAIPAPGAPPSDLASVWRNARFIALSLPFALALTAQVGFLTGQVAYLAPRIGAAAAGWAVSVTAAAAVFGRVLAGCVVDRLSCRAVAGGNFLVQALGLALLAAPRRPETLYLGCAFFGRGVGNATSLSELILHREFASADFARLVSLVVAVNQFSFAFAPSLLAAAGSAGLFLCIVLEAAAAAIVVLPFVMTRLTATRPDTQAASIEGQGGP